MAESFFVIGTSSLHIISGVRRFCDSSGLVPSFWTCGPNDVEKLKKNFPSTIVMNVFDLTCGDPEFTIENKILGAKNFDSNLLGFQEFYAFERMMVLENLLHRSDPGGAYTHSEMRDLVNRYFFIAQNLLESLNPKFVFYEVAPHVMYDLAIYYVAKKMGITNIFLMDTNIPEISFGAYSFENPYPFVLVPDLKQAKNLEKKNIFNKNVSKQKDNRPFYMSDFKYERANGLVIRQGVGLLFSVFLNYWKKAEKVRSGYEKVSGYSLGKRIGKKTSVLKQFWKYALLERYYKKLNLKFSNCTLESLKPFVYVPLSLQHERSTMPCAGFMYNQKAYIQALIANVPKGFNIIIKENPKQFYFPYLNGILNRDKEFYGDLLADHVYFAPLDFPTHDLIAESSCVAVTTGSAGFEAVVGHGIPVICFSKNWYSSLEGVSFVPDQRKLIEFFTKLKKGFCKPDAGLLAMQLEELEKFALYLWPEGGTVEEQKWDQEAMAHNISELLVAALSQ